MGWSMQRKPLAITLPTSDYHVVDNAPDSSSGDENNLFVVDFGEPESILNNDVVPYLGTFLHHLDYFEPPISKEGLIKLRYANAFHSRMPTFRRDKILNLFDNKQIIKRKVLGLVIENLLVTGDTYIAPVFNPFGDIIDFAALPSAYMRVMPDGARKPYRFCYVRNGQVLRYYKAHEVIHISETDLLESTYGTPQYFGGMQSILLNEAATLFRRKYFSNGAHLGSLFVSTSNALTTKDKQEITSKIKKSKGVGNFRSMFLHLTENNRKASDVFNIIPVGDVQTRDEFKVIKEKTEEDISAAWGVRPEVAGAMPKVVGGTGDIDKLHLLDYVNKSLPLINLLSDAINERLPQKRWLEFKEQQSLITT